MSNIDGDDLIHNTYTGGGHQYNNTTSGSTKTARLVSLKFYVDNRIVEDDEEGTANVIKMKWTNRIQATNTKKSDGTGREVLEETITLTFDGKEWKMFNEILPLEDISVHNYYGYQFNGIKTSPQSTNPFGNWKYVNSTNRELNAEASGNKDVKAIIAYGNSIQLSMILDESIDLGKRDMLFNVSTGGAFRSDEKCYFRIVNSISGNLCYWYADSYYYLKGKYIMNYIQE